MTLPVVDAGGTCAVHHSCVDAAWGTCPTGFGCYRQSDYYWQ